MHKHYSFVVSTTLLTLKIYHRVLLLLSNWTNVCRYQHKLFLCSYQTLSSINFTSVEVQFSYSYLSQFFRQSKHTILIHKAYILINNSNVFEYYHALLICGFNLHCYAVIAHSNSNRVQDGSTKLKKSSHGITCLS